VLQLAIKSVQPGSATVRKSTVKGSDDEEDSSSSEEEV